MKTPIYIKQPFDKEDSSTWPRRNGQYHVFKKDTWMDDIFKSRGFRSGTINQSAFFVRRKREWYKGDVKLSVTHWLKEADSNELKKLIG